ncbi:hypothetical protein ACFVFQ_28685 [Streptomyces sp. NPDC057743]|uniref:hypothetical protein n=1 Tax=Streptomyces sp. NPDC057743 TaxID=3346236 RepID=UPI00369B48F7
MNEIPDSADRTPEADTSTTASAPEGTQMPSLPVDTDPETQRDLQAAESVLSLLATVAIAGGMPGMILSGVAGGISVGLRLLFPPSRENIADTMARQLAALDKVLVNQIAWQSVRNEMAKSLADINVLLLKIKASRHEIDEFKKTLDWQAFGKRKTDLQVAVDAACQGTTRFLPGLQQLKSDLGTTPASSILTLGLFSTGAALHMQLELMRVMWQGPGADAQWISNIVVHGSDYHDHIAATIRTIASQIADRLNGIQPPTEHAYDVYKWKGWPDPVYQHSYLETRVVSCISDTKRATVPTRDAKDIVKSGDCGTEKCNCEWKNDPGDNVVEFKAGKISDNANVFDYWPLTYAADVETEARRYFAYTVDHEAALFVAQHHLGVIVDKYKKIQSGGSSPFGAAARITGKGMASTDSNPLTTEPPATAAQYNRLNDRAAERVYAARRATVDRFAYVRATHEGFLAASQVLALNAPTGPNPSLPETFPSAVNAYAARAYSAYQAAERARTYIEESVMGSSADKAEAAGIQAKAKAALNAALEASTGPEGNIAMYHTCQEVEAAMLQ